MICDECGNDQFDCDSGLYFCTLCQTQSQEVRVEADEVFASARNMVARDVREQRPQTKEKKEVDAGRAWQTHEAWTLILRQQVTALKKLGAHESIDSVWQQLWFTYLAKCGVAFCSPEEKEAAESNPYIVKKQRDMYPGTIENPFVHSNRKWRTMIRHGITLGKHTGKLLEDKKELAALRMKEGIVEEEEEEEEDDPHLAMIHSLLEDGGLEEDERPWMKEEQDDDEEEDEDDDDDDGDDKVLHKQRMVVFQLLPTARSSYERQASYMTLPTTTAFLYLALMHTNPLTTPHDLIRWIECSDVPFNEAASFLPDDMKFTAADTRMFTGYNLYNEQQLRDRAGRIAHFIGLSKLPTPDLMHLASRFILQLQLPGEVHSLVVQLMSRHPLHPQAEGHTIPPHAHIAMAAIVLVLKLLFGLDDHTEKQLSEFAQEVNASLPPGEKPLFVWSEWLSGQEAAGHVAPWSKHAPRDGEEEEEDVGAGVVDVGEYLEEHYPEARNFHHLRRTDCHQHTRQLTEHVRGAQERVRESLRMLHARLPKPPGHGGTTGGTTASGGQPRTDWTGSTLAYLTEGTAFLDKLHTASHSPPPQQQEEEYMSSQDIFESPARKRQKVAERGSGRDGGGAVAAAAAAAASGLERALGPRYHRYGALTGDSRAKHRAYARAVDVCAWYIGTHGAALEWYVQRLDMLYLGAPPPTHTHSRKHTTRTRRIHTRFQRLMT